MKNSYPGVTYNKANAQSDLHSLRGMGQRVVFFFFLLVASVFALSNIAPQDVTTDVTKETVFWVCGPCSSDQKC